MKLKKQSIKSTPINQLVRRGYKKCKSCGVEMHIHKRVCEKCHHENTFITKQKPQKNNSVIDFFRKMSHNEKKKVPKRFMSSIHVFKKSFLYKNDTNFDKNLQTTQILDTTFDLPKINLPQRYLLVDSVPVESGEMHAIQGGKLIYFGCAILGLAISCGVIVVSIQLNNYANQAFNELHQYGQKYGGKGTLCVLRGEKIGYFTHNEGAILQVKFHSSGILGSINSDGSFTTFSLSTNLQVKCKIQIKKQLLNCFDWSQQITALGDQDGNVYIVKLLDNSYEIINFLEQYHNGIVKDLQFYFHNDNDNPLLLSGGYDGNIKIINPMNESLIFDKHISSKGVTQVKWDVGGKFIIIINDDPNQRALMFTFFSIIKKDSQQSLQYVEKRMISPLAGNDLTQCCGMNNLHDRVYFASQNGAVYGAEVEQIRKQAIKKEKKQTYTSEQIHVGSVTIENNIVHYNSQLSSQEYDWSSGYHFIDVDENGQVVFANLLGVLIIK